MNPTVRTRPARRPAAARAPAVLTLALALTTASVPAPSTAQSPVFPDELATTSQSGQFIVVGPRVPGLSPPREYQPGTAPRTLTPQTLAIACERIKAETLRTLAIPDVWRSAGARIHVAIDPRQRPETAVPIQAAPFENTWKYQVTVPSALSEERLTRAIVQAVVLDLANRPGNQRAAEPPLWLTEGLTRSVLQSSVEGTLPTPETRTSMEVRRQGTLATVRDQFSRTEPPSFHELSQPNLDAMNEREWLRFGAGAHLCLHELRRLPDGERRLRDWILRMQSHWNWQTGFLEAFDPLFRSLLDTEKWWAITLANFTGRDAAQAWPADFTLRKLDEALQPVGLLPGTGTRARRIPLEEIVTEWDFQRQLPILRQLLQQLHAIRINAPVPLRPLALRYIDAIDSYLEERSRFGYPSATRGQPPLRPKLLVRELVERLRILEGARAQAAESPDPTPDATAQNHPPRPPP